MRVCGECKRSSQQCLKFRNVSALEKAQSPLVFLGVGDGSEVSFTFTAPVATHVYNVHLKNLKTEGTGLPGCGNAEFGNRCPGAPKGCTPRSPPCRVQGWLPGQRCFGRCRRRVRLITQHQTHVDLGPFFLISTTWDKLPQFIEHLLCFLSNLGQPGGSSMCGPLGCAVTAARNPKHLWGCWPIPRTSPLPPNPVPWVYTSGCFRSITGGRLRWVTVGDRG